MSHGSLSTAKQRMSQFPHLLYTIRTIYPVDGIINAYKNLVLFRVINDQEFVRPDD